MKKIFIFAVILSALTVSCTDNSRAKNWGGTETVELKAGETLIGITWKGDQMWVLTRDKQGVNHFREHSAWGVIEGEVILK